MALYHFSATIISRKNGISAVAAAAYRSGQKLSNDYDGVTHDYRHKQNVDMSIVLLPNNAPAEFADRQTLWSRVEQTEKQSNAQLARELEFSLPKELPKDVRERIALEFVQDELVAEGMIADVCFHNKPELNSHKQPIDVNGNPTTDPAKFIYNNPHVHVMTPLRPLDDNGKWLFKKQKVYVCEKEGKIGKFTSEQLKQNAGWEKLFHYEDKSGKRSWHTKSYADEHPEEKLTLVNRNPKSESIVNPKIEKWNSEEFLLHLREAWANKVNMAYEEMGLDFRVDHRSYADQGLDLIPTIHEGKAVTIEEKRLQEEYDQKIARGEAAVLKHTDIRNMNIAIREHNQEIRIIMELKKLREEMEKIIEPVKARIEEFHHGIAEKLERLRAEIIVIGVKIKQTVAIKGEADEKINLHKQYLKDLAPIRKERLESIKAERKELKAQVAKMTGPFTGKKREELQDKIEILSDEISVQSENRKLAAEAKKEISLLQDTSDQAAEQIEELKSEHIKKEEEYRNTTLMIPEEQKISINQERNILRPEMEDYYMKKNQRAQFRPEADEIDKKLKCSMTDLTGVMNEQSGPDVTIK